MTVGEPRKVSRCEIHLTKVQKDTDNTFQSAGIDIYVQRAVPSHPQTGTSGRSDECAGFSPLRIK